MLRGVQYGRADAWAGHPPGNSVIAAAGTSGYPIPISINSGGKLVRRQESWQCNKPATTSDPPIAASCSAQQAYTQGYSLLRPVYADCIITVGHDLRWACAEDTLRNPVDMSEIARRDDDARALQRIRVNAVR